MKTNVRSYTDDQIINRVEQLISFQGWSAGKYDIWVRSNEVEFDAYWAYRQGEPFPYFEDTNKDEKIDETGKLVLNKLIYANNHRAGQSSTQIGGWSIACLVRNVRSQYDKWMRWMNKTEKLTVCILREWDPNANIPPVDPLNRNL